MKTPLSRKVLGPLALCMLAVGCATQPQTASLECGVGGVAAAYLVCKALGKSDRDCAGFAVVGGGVGAAVCYSYASNLEKRRKQLAGRENDLDAQLQYVRGLNEDGQRLNTELRQRVDVATKRAQELSAQVGANRASERAKEKQRLEGEVKAASQQVELQKNAVQEVKSFQDKRRTPSADLDAEIAKQDRLLADAQRQVAALASLQERV
jgi:hypothetical protein